MSPRQPDTRMDECPFCGRKDGLWVEDAPAAHKRLRFTAECVCGASGAPRETEVEAIVWWNTRLEIST